MKSIFFLSIRVKNHRVLGLAPIKYYSTEEKKEDNLYDLIYKENSIIESIIKMDPKFVRPITKNKIVVGYNWMCYYSYNITGSWYDDKAQHKDIPFIDILPIRCKMVLYFNFYDGTKDLNERLSNVIIEELPSIECLTINDFYFVINMIIENFKDNKPLLMQVDLIIIKDKSYFITIDT